MRRRGRSLSPGASGSPPASCLTMPGWYRSGRPFHNDTKPLRRPLLAVQILLDLAVLPVLSEDRERSVDLEGVGDEADPPAEEDPVEPQAVGAREQIEDDQEGIDDDERREVHVEAAQLADARLGRSVTVVLYRHEKEPKPPTRTLAR